MPKIYVGTYEKYNAGSIAGAWLDLEDYSDKDDFISACMELHSDEEDPELMFQDFEDIPKIFISECSIDSEFWEYMDFDDRENGEAKLAYIECFGEWVDEDSFYEKYHGEFRSDEDFAYELLEETGALSDCPEMLKNYFDYKSYAHDMACNSEFCSHNGYYFWSN